MNTAIKNMKYFVEEYKGSFNFHNPNSLVEMMTEIQKLIRFAFELETDPNVAMVKPKLVLGESKESDKSNETLDYDGPVIHISLNRRMSTGTNDRTNKDLFDNNLISGVPKFHKELRYIKDNEEVLLHRALVQTDNEILLKVKTKTVKEQLILLNVLERALNVYCRVIFENFVNVCGIKEISAEEKADDQKFEIANVKFQMRLQEFVEIDRTFLLKGFSIFNGGTDDSESELEFATGKYVDDVWTENEPVGDYETFEDCWKTPLK